MIPEFTWEDLGALPGLIFLLVLVCCMYGWPIALIWFLLR